jgi:xylose isomerase
METTMSKRFFGDIGPVRFEGPKSDNPYAFRHYDPKRVVMGKAMAEHLRPAVCYWHNFAWLGSDMFGAPTFERPWDGETMKGARAKADAAFEMFSWRRELCALGRARRLRDAAQHRLASRAGAARPLSVAGRRI